MQLIPRPTTRKMQPASVATSYAFVAADESGQVEQTRGEIAGVRSSAKAFVSRSTPPAHTFATLSIYQPQAKLTVSQPSDPHEIEADRDEILRTEQIEDESTLEDAAGKQATPRKISAKVSREAHPGELGANGDSGGHGDDIESWVTSTIGSGGAPLSPATLRYMEPRFGHDFSRVRVHTDANASKSAEGVHAHAYTVGNDIVFRQAQYAPGTSEGDRLLAHELTHVVQQTGSCQSAGDRYRSNPDLSVELARTDSVATGRIFRLDPLASGPTGGLHLQRDDAPKTMTLDDIDLEKLDSEIALVVSLARANFVSAVSNARATLLQKQIDEASKKAFFQNFALAVGTVFLPEVLSAVSGAVQGVLKDGVLPMLKGPSAGDKSLVSQLIEEKFAPSAISGYVSSAQSVLTSKELLILGNNKYARTWSYLDGLDSVNAAVMTTTGLAALRGDKGESLKFFGIMKYLAMNAAIYREEVLTRASHFLDEVADVALGDDLSGSIVGPQLCKIDAYGRDRWARVQTGALSGWVFLQWVDPDAAEALDSQAAGKQSIPRLSPEDFAGHLPDPVRESGGQKTAGGEFMRTEWTNAWGGLRLAEVAVPEGLQGTGEYIFQRWIPISEQDAAIARGQNQIGGLDSSLPIPADKIRGKAVPTEPPLR